MTLTKLSILNEYNLIRFFFFFALYWLCRGCNRHKKNPVRFNNYLISVQRNQISLSLSLRIQRPWPSQPLSRRVDLSKPIWKSFLSAVSHVFSMRCSRVSLPKFSSSWDLTCMMGVDYVSLQIRASHAPCLNPKMSHRTAYLSLFWDWSGYKKWDFMFFPEP